MIRHISLVLSGLVVFFSLSLVVFVNYKSNKGVLVDRTKSSSDVKFKPNVRQNEEILLTPDGLNYKKEESIELNNELGKAFPGSDIITEFNQSKQFSSPKEIERKTRDAVNFQTARANVKFDYDDIILKDEVGDARLLVSRGSLEDADNSTSNASSGTLVVPTTYKIRARARSAKLIVSPVEFEERELFGNNIASWDWKIVGTEPGDAFLTIDLEHRIVVDGSSMFIPIKTFPYKVTIHVNWLQMANSWKERLDFIEKFFISVAAVIVAAGGIIIAARNFINGRMNGKI